VDEFIPASPRVVAYDPAWPQAYQQEASIVAGALAAMPHTIEHIGSTAVPGLPAKPVIDLMVGVADHRSFDEIRTALENVGYLWDPAAERHDPARKVFRKGPSDPRRLRSHHLHLTIEDGGYWRRILAFRDELRRDPAAAAEYAAVKLQLLRTCGDDSRAYTRGKRDIVKKIERAAGVDVP
jgi:GrpB-like predicted nucleotidyltransferase (UPF0157 family)